MSDKDIRDIALSEPLTELGDSVDGFILGFRYVIENFEFYKRLKSDADKYREIKKIINEQ